MKQSKFFIPTLKEAPKGEEAINAKLLIRAGFIDKVMAGVYTFLPLGLRVLKKIENIIRKEMLSAGGQELLLPALHPKENWLKTNRWDNYDTLFKFISHYSKTELALGPTHEEIISPLAAKFNLSYKDLPFYLFQIQIKFRDEKRVKSGLLRTREFIMKDLYSFHANEKDMENYYDEMKIHYKSIFAQCGIGVQTYLTFASGGSFSKYSHEFQTITLAGEDKIFLCEKCEIAINAEIISEQKVCPECGSKNLNEKKAIEVGNIFPLKTKFSESFGLKFTDENGKEKYVIMGCYGIGPGRLMGAIVEINNDEKGIIWPEVVAPFHVHLLSLNGNNGDDTSVKRGAEKLYEQLLEAGVEVLYDDRDDKTAGEKFSDADLIGIPWRIVVSEKTMEMDKIEIKKRNEKEARLMTANEFINYCELRNS